MAPKASRRRSRSLPEALHGAPGASRGRSNDNEIEIENENENENENGEIRGFPGALPGVTGRLPVAPKASRRRSRGLPGALHGAPGASRGRSNENENENENERRTRTKTRTITSGWRLEAGGRRLEAGGCWWGLQPLTDRLVYIYIYIYTRWTLEIGFRFVDFWPICAYTRGCPELSPVQCHPFARNLPLPPWSATHYHPLESFSPPVVGL